MPIQTDSLNRKLYELLNSRGYDPVPRDSDVANAGKTVPPEEADVFKFTFKQGDEAIDDAWVSVDGAENLTMYYDKNLANKAGERSPGTQFDDSWYGLLRHLKKWAHARQLSFKLEPKEKIDSDMSQRTYMKKKEQIAEGYHPMGKTASYNDAVPTVKIILQHTRQVQEGEQRYRNVAKIFLENAQGERFLSPTSKPGLAQVYARHIAEGGVPNDDRWNHLKSLCEEYSKMAGFVRAVRSNQFNESAQRVVEAGLNHYQSLRESLGKLRGHRGYTSYFESYTPPLMEDDTDSNALNELFVQETLDPRIESVMPILNKLSKNLGEMKEISELAEWADNLLEGGDGGEASEEPVQQIEEAPGAETLAHNQSTEKSRLDAFDLDETDGGQEALNPGGIPEEDELVQEGKPSKTDLAMAYLKAVVMAPTGTPENERIRNWQEKLEDEFDIEMDTATLAQMLPQFDSMLQAGKLDKLQNRMASRGELEIGESQHGVEEGMLDGSDGIDSPVASAILRRILMQRTDLLAKHGPEKVSNAIGDVAEFVGDVDEIGSSDVSGWIKQIEQSLSGVDEGILDTVKKVGGKVLDKLGHGSDEDLLKDLQKKAGVRGPNHGKPSMAQSDVEKRTDEVDMGQADSSLRSEPKQDTGKMDHFTALGKASKKMGHDHYMDVPDDKIEALKAMVKKFRSGEEVDESALQAYLGDKKYGKDGMDALRKAGQENASEKTMQNIRAKYSSKEEVAEDGQFAGDFATGEAGQWRNKGPKANKPATIGDLVGEGQEDLAAMMRIVNR
jgi:hypothetical protein